MYIVSWHMPATIAEDRLPAYTGCRIVKGVTQPLQEPTFLILTALAAQPLHGYGVIQEVAALSAGRVTLRPGTLYGALDRLVEQGLVVADREEVVDGRLRRYYRLSDEGAGVLATEAQRLTSNAAAATSRLRRRSDADASRPGLSHG
jgi:DNA-binding PadR family transcriptional regulator